LKANAWDAVVEGSAKIGQDQASLSHFLPLD
jgi:hypothetical protein